MKHLKRILIFSLLFGWLLLICVFLYAFLFVFSAINIINVEDSDYLEVSSDYVTVDSQSSELVDGGDYWLVCEESKLDSILQRIGSQPPNYCLVYSEKYAHEIIPKSSTKHLIGSENKKLLLQVAAKEIYEYRRPVIPRVVAKGNSRHFVTIVRYKKEF